MVSSSDDANERPNAWLMFAQPDATCTGVHADSSIAFETSLRQHIHGLGKEVASHTVEAAWLMLGILQDNRDSTCPSGFTCWD